MKNEAKASMVDYLELDDNTYIENDVIKTMVAGNDNRQKFVPWDEFWNNIYNRMSKIKEYDETHSRHNILTEEDLKRDYYDESLFEDDLKSLLEEFNNEVKKIDKLYESR